ncbi:hypothetical protein [Pseudomonas sp. DC3000-4b1]|uniref:hypothetical protein n=1 Tax=unclassified Pseudomonas TaxID=196821 RepID=UPI003CF8E766
MKSDNTSGRQWPRRDRPEDARGLPGRPENAGSGITGSSGGKPGEAARPQPTTRQDRQSRDDENLGAD